MIHATSWPLIVVCNEIGRIGVPLFFMLSGALLLGDTPATDFLQFYRKKLSRILIPLALWTLLYLPAYPLYQTTPPTLSQVISAVLNNGYMYHFWYLYTLIGIYLVLPFLQHLVQKLSDKQLIFLILIVIFPGTIRPLINTYLPIYLYISEPLFENYLGYVLLGYLLGRRSIAPCWRNLIFLGGLFGFCLGVGGTLLASHTVLTLPFNGGYAINHYLLAAAVFLAVKQIPLLNIPVAWIQGVSALTFGIYFIHPMFIFAVDLAVTSHPLSPLMLLCSRLIVAAFGSLLTIALLAKLPLAKRYLM